jgi:hypothetical protein
MRFHYFHALRRVWILVAVLVPVLVVGVFNGPRNLSGFLINAIPFLFLLLFWIVMLALLPYRGARRSYTAQKDLGAPSTWVFTSETLTRTTPNGFSALVWSVVIRLQETGTLFLLYIGPGSAEIVPKRFFQSPVEMDQWRQMVLSCVAPKRIEGSGLIGRWC